jgi:ComF family protein
MRPLLDGWSWPATCEICAGWPSRPVCAACLHDHGRVLPRCPGCALPLAPGLSHCTRCQGRHGHPLRRSHARVDYTYPWTGLVQRFKFHGEPAWARTLAELMLQDPEASDTLAQADWVAPIPLPLPRLLERGYNQAWELVRQLRRRVPGAPPALADLLQRADATTPIHTLPRAERLVHARHAFAVAPAHRPRLAGRHVLLVDDVMTTGATLNAAAQALRDAGAAAVSAWVFARTPAPGSVE